MTPLRPERAFRSPLQVLLQVLAAWAAAGFCLLPPLHALDGFAWTRQLEVPAAGWVRVPLDIAALRHMAPGGADLHVFAPGGEAIPVRLAAMLPESASRPAQVKRQGERAWVVDTGADPFLHERLVLDLATRATSIPALRLESSPGALPAQSSDSAEPPDGWQTLASAVPVRLGGAEGVQRVAIAYPSTSDRFLRLLWPADSAPPAFASAAVETVTGPLLTIAAQGPPCRRGGSASICTLEIPAGQVLRRLTVDVQGEKGEETGAVGYRLQAAVEARWELLAEGVWQGPGRHVLAGGPRPVAGAALRLELHGRTGGRSAPRAVGYVADLAVPTVAFRAPGPGRHLLAYGGVRGGAATAGNVPGKALWLEPGPEQPGARPPLPAGPGAPLDRIRFSNDWEISAPDAEPGDLVRLELPPTVYGAAREDLGDLRLAAGERQIPFFRWSPPDPAHAAGNPGLRPAESDRPGESRVVVPLPSEGLPLTQIHLSAAPAPWRRSVTVVYVDPDRRSRSGQAASSTWECAPAPPLPCRIRMELSGTAPRLLTVRLRDGEDPRLPALGVSVWRRRDVLLFVWPELEKGGTARLLAGSENLEAPGYGLEALGPALLGHPWRTAELRRAGAVAETPWWSRWVMPLGVTVVAAWLVWLLRRILSEA